MAKNIEIKAYLKNRKQCLEAARTLSGGDPEIIQQEDYFFNCEKGRLKLRFLSENKGLLVFYKRENDNGPSISEYYISETDEPGQLLKVLEKSYGISGNVTKTRELFLVGRTRVHIDRVDTLGDFIELEVVMTDNENEESATREAYYLMEQLGISKDSLIDCAYFDLIKEKERVNN